MVPRALCHHARAGWSSGGEAVVPAAADPPPPARAWACLWRRSPGLRALLLNDASFGVQ
jgi:hypothetical protein